MIKVIPLSLALILALGACSMEQTLPAPPSEAPAEPIAPPTDPTDPSEPPAVPVAPNPPATPGTPPGPTPPEDTELAVTLSADVTEGEAPLTVEFTASADQEGVSYEWYVADFYLEWEEAQLSYTFEEPGTFEVLVAAFNEGLEVAVDVVSVTVAAPPEAPVEPPADPVEPPTEPVDPPEAPVDPPEGPPVDPPEGPVQPEPPTDPPVEPEQRS